MVVNEKAAAQRVIGLSQAVAWRYSFCCSLFMNFFLFDAQLRVATFCCQMDCLASKKIINARPGLNNTLGWPYLTEPTRHGLDL
jgi:hypothetical protein